MQTCVRDLRSSTSSSAGFRTGRAGGVEQVTESTPSEKCISCETSRHPRAASATRREPYHNDADADTN
jgi:hypothetical protein